MKYINGWQRLWILVSVLSGIVIIWFALLSLPTPDSVETKEILKKLSTDSLILLAEAERGKDIEMFNGEHLTLPVEATADQVKKISADYRKAVESITYEKRQINRNRILRHIGTSIVIWLALSVSLYSLGYAIGWVYRGFKKKP